MELSFDARPSSAKLFAKALVPKPRVLSDGKTIPRLDATLGRVVPDARELARYRTLCGFAHDDTLPPTYPHVLAAPVHLALLTHEDFPLRLLGGVHVRNRIVQKRALRSDEPLDIRVTVEGHTPVENGVEVNVLTRVGEDWESTSTVLLRGPRREKSSSKPFTPPDLSAFRSVATIEAPEDIGRRYGLVAHDLNPIHVHALTARAFGFPRAIAHGMWSFARCVAEVTRARVVGQCTLDVAFKRPLLLPGKAVLAAREDGQIVLHDGENKTIYLTGSITSRG